MSGHYNNDERPLQCPPNKTRLSSILHAQEWVNIHKVNGHMEHGGPGQQKFQGSAYQQPDLSDRAPLLGQMGGGGHRYLGRRGEMMGVGWGLGWDGAGVVN